MKKAGFTILGHDECPIAPVYLGDAKVAGYSFYLVNLQKSYIKMGYLS